MKNADSPAMPIGDQMDSMHLNPLCNGLTKREEFARTAMLGFISAGVLTKDRIVEKSIMYAEALLKELEDK